MKPIFKLNSIKCHYQCVYYSLGYISKSHNSNNFSLVRYWAKQIGTKMISSSANEMISS